MRGELLLFEWFELVVLLAPRASQEPRVARVVEEEGVALGAPGELPEHL